MSSYKLHIFKPFEKGSVGGKYRLAVIDPYNSQGYPSNFVCVLPKKIYDKGKPMTLFAKMFGPNSVEYAIELLKAAIPLEQDQRAKAELQKRLRGFNAQKSAESCLQSFVSMDKHS